MFVFRESASAPFLYSLTFTVLSTLTRQVSHILATQMIKNLPRPTEQLCGFFRQMILKLNIKSRKGLFKTHLINPLLI